MISICDFSLFKGFNLNSFHIWISRSLKRKHFSIPQYMNSIFCKNICLRPTLELNAEDYPGLITHKTVIKKKRKRKRNMLYSCNKRYDSDKAKQKLIWMQRVHSSPWRSSSCSSHDLPKQGQMNHYSAVTENTAQDRQMSL